MSCSNLDDGHYVYHVALIYFSMLLFEEDTVYGMLNFLLISISLDISILGVLFVEAQNLTAFHT